MTSETVEWSLPVTIEELKGVLTESPFAKIYNFKLHSIAKTLKLGQNLIYGVAESTSPAGRRLAHHTITYIRL